MMKWLVRVVVALALAAALMALIGLALPVGHQASRSAEIAARRDAVFALLRDVERYPEWRTGISAVAVLEVIDGLPRFREDGESGPIIFRLERADAPAFMRTRVDDPDQPFGGTWTFVLVPGDSGTLLTITEDGEVYNPLFRFLSRFVFSQTATLDAYVADVQRRFSSPR